PFQRESQQVVPVRLQNEQTSKEKAYRDEEDRSTYCVIGESSREFWRASSSNRSYYHIVDQKEGYEAKERLGEAGEEDELYELSQHLSLPLQQRFLSAPHPVPDPLACQSSRSRRSCPSRS